MSGSLRTAVASGWRRALAVLALAAGGLAIAQQPPAATPSEGPATAPSAGPAATPAPPPTAKPADDAPQDSASATPDAAPPPPAAARGSPQRFEPTERVRPDFDVAFPIDI